MKRRSHSSSRLLGLCLSQAPPPLLLPPHLPPHLHPHLPPHLTPHLPPHLPPRVSGSSTGDSVGTRSKMASSSPSSSVECGVTLEPRLANQSLGLYIRGGADSDSTPTVTDLDVGGYAAGQVSNSGQVRDEEEEEEEEGVEGRVGLKGVVLGSRAIGITFGYKLTKADVFLPRASRAFGSATRFCPSTPRRRRR